MIELGLLSTNIRFFTDLEPGRCEEADSYWMA